MKTTFGRNFAAITILLLAALVMIGLFFQLLVKDYLTDSEISSLEDDAQVITELVQAYYSENQFAGRDFHTALTVAASASGSDAVVCDARGKLIVCASHPLGCKHRGLMLGGDYLERCFQKGGLTDTGVISGLYPDSRYVVSKPVYTTGGDRLALVIVSSPVGSTLAVMERIMQQFVTVAIVVVAVSMVLMTLYLRRQTRPLKQMSKAARDFGHGDLSARVNTNGTYYPEIEELALSFNNMASALEKSEYQRQEFVANVSHELKTPMTTISGYVDGILDGTIPPERSRHYLKMVSDETKRLSRLVRSMLDISRLQDQGGIPEDQKTRFDVTESAGQVLISFEQKINGKKLDVQVEMPELPVYTLAQQDYITQVIYNLLDNAVKFSPQGGTVSLQMKTAAQKIYLSICNEGQTIAPEELSLLFDRFHKTDKSRSEDRDSWGLGLHIVKTILDAHDENISVTSREGKTTFTFTLPLVN